MNEKLVEAYQHAVMNPDMPEAELAELVQSAVTVELLASIAAHGNVDEQTRAIAVAKLKESDDWNTSARLSDIAMSAAVPLDSKLEVTNHLISGNVEINRWVLNRLAAAPDIEPEIVTLLIDAPNAEVRAIAVWQPTVTDKQRNEVLASIIKDGGDVAAIARIAADERTPEQLLRLIAERQPVVGLLDNPKLPRDLVVEVSAACAASDEAEVRARAAKMSSDPKILERLAEDSDDSVLEAVAGNPATSPDTLTRLAALNLHKVRVAIAGNPSSPVDALELLLTEYEASSIACVHPRVSPEIIRTHLATIPLHALGRVTEPLREQLIREWCALHPNEWQTSAGREFMPADLAASCAAHPDKYVRAGIAENPGLDSATLAKLAQDTDWWVRLKVAHNANTSANVLEQLARDTSSNVSDEAMRNPNLPDEVRSTLIAAGAVRPSRYAELMELPLEQLGAAIADDTTGEDTYRLIFNREDLSAALIEQAIKKVAEVGTNSVHLAHVAAHQHLPVDTAQRLAKSKAADVREALAANHAVPEDVLALLTKDKSVSVQLKLIQHAPWKIAGQILNARIATLQAKATKEADKPTTVAGRVELMFDAIFDAAEFEKLLQDKAVGIRVAAWFRAAELGLCTFKDARIAIDREGHGALGAKYAWVERRLGKQPDLTDQAMLDLAINFDASRHINAAIAHKRLTERVAIRQVLEERVAGAAWTVATTCELDEELLRLIADGASTSYEVYAVEDTEKLDIGQIASIGNRGMFVTNYPQIVVALHPEVPSDVLDTLRSAKSKFVRAACYQRADCTAEQLDSAARDKAEEVRAAVAQHPTTSNKTLLRLAADKHESVRAAVCSRPDATDELRALAALA